MKPTFFQRDFWSLGLILLAFLACIYLSGGFFPLVFLAFCLWFWGGSLTSFLAAVVGSVVFAEWFLRSKIDVGIQWNQLIQGSLGIWILALMVMGGFMEALFMSPLVKDGAMNATRRIFKSPSSRSFGAILASFCCFIDDAASCLVMNHFLKDDIQCQGVDKRVKESFLRLIVIGSNLPAALIVFSTWGLFFKGEFIPDNPGYFYMLLAVYPLSALLYLLFSLIGFKTSCSSQGTKHQQLVFRSDLLAEPDSGMPGRWKMASALPLFVFIVLLIAFGVAKDDGDKALISGEIGLFGASLCGYMLLWVLNHFYHKNQGWEPDSLLEDVEEKLDAFRDTVKGHLSTRQSTFGQGNVLNKGAESDLRECSLKELDEICRTDLTSITQRLESGRERYEPAMRTEHAAFEYTGEKCRQRMDSQFKKGFQEMASGFLRVFCVLVVSAIMSLCLGLKGEFFQVKETVPHLEELTVSLPSTPLYEGGLRDWLQKDTAGFVSAWSQMNEGWKFFWISNFFVGLMLFFRALQFSSTWGLVAIFIPLGGSLLEMTISEENLKNYQWLLYCLVLSFGVWCNQTRETGDTVELTAEMQGWNARELTQLTEKPSMWFLGATCLFVLAVAPVCISFGWVDQTKPNLLYLLALFCAVLAAAGARWWPERTIKKV